MTKIQYIEAGDEKGRKKINDNFSLLETTSGAIIAPLVTIPNIDRRYFFGILYEVKGAISDNLTEWDFQDSSIIPRLEQAQILLEVGDTNTLTVNVRTNQYHENGGLNWGYEPHATLQNTYIITNTPEKGETAYSFFLMLSTEFKDDSELIGKVNKNTSEIIRVENRFDYSVTLNDGDNLFALPYGNYQFLGSPSSLSNMPPKFTSGRAYLISVEGVPTQDVYTGFKRVIVTDVTNNLIAINTMDFSKWTGWIYYGEEKEFPKVHDWEPRLWATDESVQYTCNAQYARTIEEEYHYVTLIRLENAKINSTGRGRLSIGNAPFRFGGDKFYSYGNMWVTGLKDLHPDVVSLFLAPRAGTKEFWFYQNRINSNNTIYSNIGAGFNAENHLTEDGTFSVVAQVTHLK